LESFAFAKEKQSQELAVKAGERISPCSGPFSPLLPGEIGGPSPTSTRAGSSITLSTTKAPMKWTVEGRVANPWHGSVQAVSTDAGGAIRPGADPVPMSIEDFKEKLLAAVANTPDLHLHIRADEGASNKAVMKVTAVAREAKVVAVSVHQPPEKK
jgi:biopolymer transport protein ExbD